MISVARAKNAITDAEQRAVVEQAPAKGLIFGFLRVTGEDSRNGRYKTTQRL